MSFTTAWSANAVSICAACGLSKVTRIEPSRRYQLHSSQPLSEADIAKFAVMVHTALRVNDRVSVLKNSLLHMVWTTQVQTATLQACCR